MADKQQIRRRGLLQGALGVIATPVVAAWARAGRGNAAPVVGAALTPVEVPPAQLTRTWLGPSYWANRLGDFRLTQGRMECLDAGRLRSVSVLTRELNGSAGSATISVRTGTLASGAGFSGFLVGAGAGQLDYRAAALVQAAAGTNGGLLCVYDSDGQVKFRDHESESKPLGYAVKPSSARSGTAPPRASGEDVVLSLTITPDSRGSFTLRLGARRFSGNALLHTAELTGVPARLVTGGIALVSSPLAGSAARYWFRDLQTSGTKITDRPDRSLGPILGTLFSLSGPVLKMTAQFLPVGASEDQTARLQIRAPGTTAWADAGVAGIGAGYTAQFRITDWDASRDWDYRVVWGLGTPAEHAWTGTVGRDPSAQARVTVGAVNCVVHTYRRLDAGSKSAPRLPGESTLGLYTDQNLYFPYAPLVENLGKQTPDLLVALGDQFYEHRPTEIPTGESPTLDFLYKYYLWLWSFRELTRDRPTIVMVDDHDVLQGNLWGNEGAEAPNNNQGAGGYVKSADFVNAVQRVQTGHNPDAYDPTPVQQGITVSYGAFSYGGVSFAFVEDRKFKYGPRAQGPTGPTPVEQLPILGPRQEAFLEDWVTMHPGQPKVCLTQTVFASVQTDPERQPLRESDSASYPEARNRALGIIKRARAVMVSGDQHLSSVVRHGVTSFEDGPVQFVGPAGGTAYQRWFEAEGLANPGDTPHTGDFTDAWGNKAKVLAVANPKVTLAEYQQAYPGQRGIGDRALKSEGYAVVFVDKAAGEYVMEAWPWEVDPSAPEAEPFAGWPVRVAFESA